MDVLLVRHGESVWNLEGRFQGQKDSPLSPRGVAQAQALATRLRTEPIDAIFSSPLSRAAATARCCAEALKLQVALDERLLEISHGTWEGRLRADVAAQDGDLLQLWQAQPERVRFPQGETLADVDSRLNNFWRALAASHHRAVLLLTHDVVVRLAVLAAQQRPLAEFHQVEIDNAALNRFTLHKGLLTLVRLNDADFLGELRSSLATQAR